MSPDEIKNLKLGDYIKRSRPNQSDEYFLVTGIAGTFKLRRIGNKELIKTNQLHDFIKINSQF